MRGVVERGRFRRCAEYPHGYPQCCGRAVYGDAPGACTCFDFTKAERDEAHRDGLTIDGWEHVPPAWRKRRGVGPGRAVADAVCAMCMEEAPVYGTSESTICATCASHALQALAIDGTAANTDLDAVRRGHSWATSVPDPSTTDHGSARDDD